MNMRYIAIIALIMGSMAVLLHQPPMMWRVIVGMLFGACVVLITSPSRKCHITVSLIGIIGLVTGIVLG